MDWILTTMRIIMTFFKSPDAFLLRLLYKGTLGSLIEKYISHDVIQQIAKHKDISRLIDPATIMSMLKQANAREIDSLMKELKQLNKGERLEAIKELNVTQSTPINLSSSWVKKGAFIQYANSQAGNLIIWTHSETAKNSKWYGPYIYPSVLKETWLRMRAAKSKYGSRTNPIGAGSVMWHDFLDEWLPSQLRSYILEHKSEMSPTGYDANVMYLRKLEKNFHKIGSPQANIQKSRFISDKLAYQGQKSVIVSSSRERLAKSLESVKNPMYDLNKALEKYTSKINRVKRNLNIRQQTLKVGKKVIFGYADAMKGKNAK